MSEHPFLRLQDVTKDYPSGQHTLNILKGLNLTIHQGETIAITGPSGSGKSTLLAILASLETISSGSIHLENQAIHQWNENQLATWRRQQVGFVFQDFRLIPSFTALENVSLPLELLGKDNQTSQTHATQLLQELGLKERIHHFPNQLSGGEQQRVAIARAYAHQPKIIFADEPTGNLDPKTSEHVIESLMHINKQRQTTLVLVTHDMDLAQLMERRVALKNGKIVSEKQPS